VAHQQSADLPPLEEERAVVARIRQGDREAAGILFEWFANGLYRRAILPRLPNPELAEDVLKDTFRTALEKIDCLHARDRKAQQHRETTIERTMSQAPPAPDRAPEVAETRDQVNAALEELNPRYADALRMRLIEDRDREECAAAMGVTVGNFDVILHRAAKAFRKVYPQ
jgi:RNA polymerase sigma-70 factor (ECF subfamily)